MCAGEPACVPVGAAGTCGARERGANAGGACASSVCGEPQNVTFGGSCALRLAFASEYEGEGGMMAIVVRGAPRRGRARRTRVCAQPRARRRRFAARGTPRLRYVRLSERLRRGGARRGRAVVLLGQGGLPVAQPLPVALDVFVQQRIEYRDGLGIGHAVVSRRAEVHLERGDHVRRAQIEHAGLRRVVAVSEELRLQFGDVSAKRPASAVVLDGDRVRPCADAVLLVQHSPRKERARIEIAAGRDVRVPDNLLRRDFVTRGDVGREAADDRHLRVRERRPSAPHQRRVFIRVGKAGVDDFDADRTRVEQALALPVAHARVPRAVRFGHECIHAKERARVGRIGHEIVRADGPRRIGQQRDGTRERLSGVVKHERAHARVLVRRRDRRVDRDVLRAACVARLAAGRPRGMRGVWRRERACGARRRACDESSAFRVRDVVAPRLTGLAHSVGPPGRASGALPVTGRSRFASQCVRRWNGIGSDGADRSVDHSGERLFQAAGIRASGKQPILDDSGGPIRARLECAGAENPRERNRRGG
ncbi:hypothetical protein Y048_5953 [Burkholderia pseudomallei MSHR456]|nr:hypothetical protein Y048_5953 [Burkholderia pseudomallei MSHR456]